MRQTFINNLLDEIPDMKMLLGYNGWLHDPFQEKRSLYHLITLLRSLIRNGLKISPTNWQLFTVLRSWVDTTQGLEPPKTPIECNKLSAPILYLRNLQKKLIPIYNLIRKGIPFVWIDEHQKTFDEMKKDLSNPLVLVPQMTKDISHHEQRGQSRIVGYSSKKLPSGAIRYIICELELCGIYIFASNHGEIQNLWW